MADSQYSPWHIIVLSPEQDSDVQLRLLPYQLWEIIYRWPMQAVNYMWSVLTSNYERDNEQEG